MVNSKTILVTGGTGNQGGEVARHLVQHGYHVKALTRNPASAKAQDLLKLNIEVVKGDLNDTNSYKDHLKEVSGIFSVQSFEEGVKKEIKQGCSLATLAKEYGIKHFVYSSALAADLHTGVPHIESKFVIENHVKQSGLPYTIIRPTSLYENFLIPQVKKGILKGKLMQPIKSTTVLQYVGSGDIGKAVVKIFDHPDLYSGKTITLATEQMSTQEVADAFTKALNKPVKYGKLPGIITRLFMGSDLYKMFKWMDGKSNFSKEDVNNTRKEFPNVTSLQSWIKEHFNSSNVK